MDLPLHVATGAFVGNALLYADQRFRKSPPSRKEQIKLGIAGFLLGVLSHLFWDTVPHYDWLFYVHIFKPLPFFWLIPQILTTIPVLIFVYHLHREHWLLMMVSVFGGVYPDIEKLAYFDLHIPRTLTLFRRHSCYLTQWTPWELAHKEFLIWFEVWMFFAILIGSYWIALRTKQLHETRVYSLIIPETTYKKIITRERKILWICQFILPPQPVCARQRYLLKKDSKNRPLQQNMPLFLQWYALA